VAGWEFTYVRAFMREESRRAHASAAWNSTVILSLLRRQLGDLELNRILLLQQFELPPDDNPALLHVLAEMRSLRQMADDIEIDLSGE
jgi:hypothetical protein